MATIEQIRQWRDSVAALSPGPHFMGKPEAWFEDLHWFCPNGHVSGRFLKCEDADRCLACREPVLMGPPMSERQFQEMLGLSGR